MTTLLLRLEGPLQSWGTQSRFTERDTGREPSKSGVIGLLGAALGRPRTALIDDLAALMMGVRVDREGTIALDYHTVGGSHSRAATYGVAEADGKGHRTVESRRYYLADASFLVGLEARDARGDVLLRELDAALARPTWQLSLGRKAFVPSVPIRLPEMPPFGPSLRDLGLVDALRAYPWPQPRGRYLGGTDQRLRFVIEAQPGTTAEVRNDVPISFEIAHRAYAARWVKTDFHDPLPTESTP